MVNTVSIHLMLHTCKFCELCKEYKVALEMHSLQGWPESWRIKEAAGFQNQADPTMFSSKLFDQQNQINHPKVNVGSEGSQVRFLLEASLLSIPAFHTLQKFPHPLNCVDVQRTQWVH